MSVLSRYVPEETTLPADVRAAFNAAEPLVDQAGVDKGLDQLAVRLTVRFQSRTPLLLAAVPAGLFLLAAVLQRIVFPCRVAIWPSASPPPVGEGGPVVFIGGSLSSDDIDKWRTELADAGIAEVCAVALIAGRGVDLAALEISPPQDRRLLGCGFEVAGYGHNLPELFVYPGATT